MSSRTAFFLSLIGLLVISCAKTPSDPVIAATLSGNVPEMKRLLKAGAQPDQRDTFGNTALLYSAGADLKDSEREMLKDGRIKASGENLEILSLLIASGANPNAVGGSGYTPVIAAVFHGRMATLEKLLAAGANPNAPSNFGWTPLMYATDRCDLEMVRLLFKRGGSALVKDASGTSAESLAVMKCKAAMEIFRSASENGRQVAKAS